MAVNQMRLTFQPSGRRVYAMAGTTVLEAAARAGQMIATPCGGAGTCGKCRVRFIEGAPEATPEEVGLFSSERLAEGWRLACQSKPAGNAVVEIPDESLLVSGGRILTESALQDQPILPAVRKVFFELTQPTLDDNVPDMQRLERVTGPAKVDLELLKVLPDRLAEFGYSGTAVLTDHHLIDVQQGDTTDTCCGIAVDIGTTTIAASLLDLHSGREQAVASDINPQVRFGDDVLSRIGHAGKTPGGLGELNRSICEAIDALIGRLCRTAGIGRAEVYELTLAGNTTMQHILCGLDPTPLGRVPFVPVHRRALMLRASELGLAIHPRGNAYVFPIIGAFVGGDTSAGLLAAQLDPADGPMLFIDIGTNGEIVLADGDRLLAASTAAGPAFEGARISSGMRATRGAIEKIAFADEIRLSVIGDADPAGICGSGLLDLTAEMLRYGMLTPEGLILPPEQLPETLPPAIRRCVGTGENGQAFVRLAAGSDAEVCLTQRDIRELQLAAGAIRAGVSILLKRAQIRSDQLSKVLLAGGFGSFIRRSNAQRIGLLPTGLDHRKIHYMGNASLSGAKLALLSTDARNAAERLSAAAEHVELSQDADFQMEFAEAMIFPES
ncbi:MAG: ASKHA domain-containing protein [Phycisphaerae bacterium]